ncbi:putative phage related protein [Wolbachia endosymbiont of Culex quinquefasciatus JHB]|nr:putative phage related protein [Wolbachia endosymbiont of Culex quinquefasciatus JHB]
MIRSILESARNIHTNDTSEKAVLARKINSIADLNGLEFTAKVGIEANNTYGDRNRIATVITPEQEKNSDADWIPF